MSGARNGPAPAGSVGEAVAAASEAFAAAGIDTPRLDAELLVGAATGAGRAELVAHPEAPIAASAGRELSARIRRRVGREPLAYILGRRSFRYLELISDRRALVPRPETELLVDVALELLGGEATVLDIGTGSGAVALAIASELPGCRAIGTDTSEPALELARENALRLDLAGRVEFEAGTLPAGEARPDLILANLPYVPDAEWGGLAPEIRLHEPRQALLGGPDGLDLVREVAAAIAARYAQLPPVALEVGAGQAAETAAILEGQGWARTETRTDLAGIERVVVGHAG